MLDVVRRVTARFLGGDKPIKRWSREELHDVKNRLESTPPEVWEVQDYDLCLDYLKQRYMSEDDVCYESSWKATKDRLMKKIIYQMEHPDEHNEPIPDDPEFAAWLDETLGMRKTG